MPIPIVATVGIAVVKALAPLIMELVTKHDRGELTDEQFAQQWAVMARQLTAANTAWDDAGKAEASRPPG